MAEVDLSTVEKLAESAERRAKDHHLKYQQLLNNPEALSQARAALNDFFYWSGKATSYRGIVAMAELQTVVEDELDAEARCP